MQKRFGQNFMISPHERSKLSDEMEIKKGEEVWEIGAGLGALTKELLKRGAKVSVFEIDRGFISALNELFSSYIQSGNLEIVEGDVMKTWKEKRKTQGGSVKIFGNLPYNIAASFIASLIEEGFRFERAVFTMQKEVALRILSKVGEEDYSSLSVLCSHFYRIKKISSLSPECFFPPPNVFSTSLLFIAKEKTEISCKKFASFLRLIFRARRKTLQNNLLFAYEKEKINHLLFESAIEGNARAENLTEEEILLLYKKFCE